jgi:hypothetical protein
VKESVNQSLKKGGIWNGCHNEICKLDRSWTSIENRSTHWSTSQEPSFQNVLNLKQREIKRNRVWSKFHADRFQKVANSNPATRQRGISEHLERLCLRMQTSVQTIRRINMNGNQFVNKSEFSKCLTRGFSFASYSPCTQNNPNSISRFDTIYSTETTRKLRISQPICLELRTLNRTNPTPANDSSQRQTIRPYWIGALQTFRAVQFFSIIGPETIFSQKSEHSLLLCFTTISEFSEKLRCQIYPWWEIIACRRDGRCLNINWELGEIFLSTARKGQKSRRLKEESICLSGQGEDISRGDTVRWLQIFSHLEIRRMRRSKIVWKA